MPAFQGTAHAGADSVWAQAGAHYQRSKAGQLFLGSHYRNVWAAQVKAPVFRLGSTLGGLSIQKLGGGMQTTSLTLTDSAGRSFALRSIDKDPAETLPPFWRKTFVSKFVRDQISAANPYAALVVAPLAEAAGIFHTNPQLAFVLPTDSSLGKYASHIPGQLFMLEEKFNSRAALTSAFGEALDVLDTEELLEKSYQSARHQPDRELYARCRLFDILIGDWDRHEGQWDWAAYQQQQGVVYKPIPKDRDQAFCHYTDGILPWLATRYYRKRKFTGFGHAYPPLEALSYNARFLDTRLLNTLSRTDFETISRKLQEKLTDDVIDAAVKAFPPNVYKQIGEETAAKLKARRDKLPSAAAAFYALLAKEVFLTGTDEAELIEINHLPGQKVRITISQLPEGMQAGRERYSRTFSASETQKITIHPLAGSDVVQVSGKAEPGIHVSVVIPKGVTISNNSTGANQVIFTPAEKAEAFVRARER